LKLIEDKTTFNQKFVVEVLKLTLEQTGKENCQDCGHPLKLIEIDNLKGMKVEKCTNCDMLYFYKRNRLGKWQLQKATTSQIFSKNMFASLIEPADFLGFDTNWSLATCALQLQEVAVTLVAKKKNIILDKPHVEKVLGKKIKDDISFNDRYEAFTKQLKDLFNVDMPILTTHLRKMRMKVLHEGYNPKPEETESIVNFTIGLLQRLKGINETT